MHYEVVQYIKGTEKEYDSGVHIHYFNTKVKDETFLSELLQYMKNSDPNNNNFGALSRQVNYHKYQNEGVGSMCKAVEEYAKEYAKEREIKGKAETVKNMLKESIPLDVALKCAQIDKETYEKYAQ